MPKTLIIILIVALAVFFFPKHKVNSGFGPPGSMFTKFKCFGIARYTDVPDATLMTCYGVPYAVKTTY